MKKALGAIPLTSAVNRKQNSEIIVVDETSFENMPITFDVIEQPFPSFSVMEYGSSSMSSSSKDASLNPTEAKPVF